MTERITISMPDELAERINAQLDYGDNRSELIRELVERGLDEVERDQQHRAATETPGGDEAGSDDLRERAERRLDELDVPGRPMRVERTRRRAIMYAWERLREEGSMKPKRLATDTLGQFFEDSDLNYSTSSSRYPGYQLWDSCVRDVLRELPGVIDNSPEWRFDGTA